MTQTDRAVRFHRLGGNKWTGVSRRYLMLVELLLLLPADNIQSRSTAISDSVVLFGCFPHQLHPRKPLLDLHSIPLPRVSRAPRSLSAPDQHGADESELLLPRRFWFRFAAAAVASQPSSVSARFRFFACSGDPPALQSIEPISVT